MFKTAYVTAVSAGSPDSARERISLHHNVWARNSERQPKVKYQCKMVDYVNNVIYGWGWMESGGRGLQIEPNGSDLQLHVTKNIFHFVPDLYGGGEDNAIFYSGTGHKVRFDGNIVPSGETGAVSTAELPPDVPGEMQVTTFEAQALGDEVLPYVGTHYPTQEEIDILNEVSLAVGGSGVSGDQSGNNNGDENNNDPPTEDPDDPNNPDDTTNPDEPFIPEADPTEITTNIYNSIISPSKGSQAIIHYELDKEMKVKIIVYDSKGKEIKVLVSEHQGIGMYDRPWSGTDSSGKTVGSGIYIVHIDLGGQNSTKKIAVVR